MCRMTLRRPRRIEGFSYRGFHRYLLTFCTAHRAPHLSCAERVATAKSRIEQTATEERFSISAICFMPDHLHILIVGLTETADAQRFVKIAKQRVTYSLREQHGVRNVWQEGYHDWVLRPHQSTQDVIRYVLSNPVRAGLVRNPEDYPFSFCKDPGALSKSGADPPGPR